MKKYLVLTSTVDTLGEARQLKIDAKSKWPHMLYWIVEIDFDLEGVEP